MWTQLFSQIRIWNNGTSTDIIWVKREFTKIELHSNNCCIKDKKNIHTGAKNNALWDDELKYCKVSN